MWKSFFKDYLSFTRRDRNGVLVLLAMIVVIAILPYIRPDKKPFTLSGEELKRMKDLNAGLRKGDSTVVEGDGDRSSLQVISKTTTSLFHFNPNELDENGWLRLGIRPKTISTIIHYREKGGRFKAPEDLKRIYGLKEDDYTRLSPWVRIPRESSRDSAKHATEPYQRLRQSREYDRPGPKKQQEPVDINLADTAALIALPGIGNALAIRITRFREKLGGFYSVKQVAETYGLPDSTFGLIEPMLSCSPAVLRRINMNTASLDELKQHPYIRWAIANAIVRYRSQHGDFHAADELLNVQLINEALLEKLKPYLVFP